MEPLYLQAAETIKGAILRGQYRAVQRANGEQLALYYGIGRFISLNSRDGFWGTGAIEAISEKLRKDLPGLRGFSTRNLKNMRTFYEEWSEKDENSLIIPEETLSTSESGLIRQLQLPNLKDFPLDAFLSIGFTHHTLILAQTQTLEERLFYIQRAAAEHLSADALKRVLREDLFHHQGKLANNFLQRISPADLARRSVLAFKDEYLLDFMNVEELGARDIEDVDERVVENKIVQNIKNFIMTFGQDFSFIGNQYRIDALGHTHFIDLLFFHRGLASLVAIELKTGPFKAAYLGQLNLYLRLLDDYVRKPNENPSIGLILCKDADKTYVEYAIQDYEKPMGVATFKTADDMPEHLRRALPDFDDLRKLL